MDHDEHDQHHDPNHDDPATAGTGSDIHSQASTRRRFVRTAALTALGGAAAGTALGAQPAAATVGFMRFGTNQDAGFDLTSLTSVRAAERTLSVSNTGANGYAFGGEADTVYGGFGTTFGIDMTAGGTGARLRAPIVGVDAVAENAGGIDAVGMTVRGITAPGDDGYGVIAFGTTYGAVLSGQRAPLRLERLSGHPTSDHLAGELYAQDHGDQATLWFAVRDGNPGVFRKLAGPQTAGQLHLIDPIRVYDSRLDSAFASSRIGSGDDRLISVADGRDLTSGAVTTPNVVAAGATGIAYNIAIVDTAAAGFLSVAPGGATTYTASSINWSASGQALANGLVVRLDDNRRVQVFAGGGGSTHFVIDVQGYYL